jgi:hypothetical protein
MPKPWLDLKTISNTQFCHSTELSFLFGLAGAQLPSSTPNLEQNCCWNDTTHDPNSTAKAAPQNHLLACSRQELSTSRSAFHAQHFKAI